MAVPNMWQIFCVLPFHFLDVTFFLTKIKALLMRICVLSMNYIPFAFVFSPYMQWGVFTYWRSVAPGLTSEGKKLLCCVAVKEVKTIASNICILDLVASSHGTNLRIHLCIVFPPCFV